MYIFVDMVSRQRRTFLLLISFAAFLFVGTECQSTPGKQATSATFNGYSYISFSLQRSRIVSNNDDIVFDFQTAHPNGLIMHVGEQYDYIYVAIIDGVLEVAVNLGSGEYHTRVEPRGNTRYTDNEWHKVRISRERREVSIRVDESLLATGETQGDFSALTADGEFFVGGASDPRSLPGSNVGENFVGNLRDVFYYGESVTIDLLDKARTANSFVFIEGEVIFDVTTVEAINPITFMTEESYLRLPRWNATIKGTISFSFRTNEPDAVIIYGKGAEGMSDFFAFELLDGYLWLVLDLGSGSIRHRRNTFPLNDGDWHTVTLMRDGNIGLLQVDSDAEHTNFTVEGSNNHLNLDTELFLGGIDQTAFNSLPMDLFLGFLRRGYVGCIKNLAIDGETMDLPNYVLKESRDDIGAFCREYKPQCVSNPCHNYGVCTEGWNRFVCDCRRTGYTGKTCADEVARLSFNGYQYMKVTLPDSRRSKVEDINLRFKTRHPNGVLVATTSDTVNDLLMIELKNGVVRVSANYGQGLNTSITAGTHLDDNRWHSIHVSRNDDTLTLSVDDVDRAEVGKDYQAGILDYRYIEVGAMSDTNNFEEIPPNFQGHMEHFLYNNHPYFDLARGGHITGYELTAQFGERITQRPIRDLFTFKTKEVYVELPTPSTYDPHLTLFFQFKTAEPNGLIVYCGGATDFITIELVDGRIHYAFNLGGGTTVMEANTRTLLNDNLWHEVSIVRDSRDRHVLKVDDSATIATPGAGNLDLTDNLYIGGVEDFRYQFLPVMVEATQGFQGCFASLEVNGARQNLLDTTVSIEVYDEIIEGCEEHSQLCEDHDCANGGICVAGWNSYTCNCDMTSFVGQNCSNVSTTYEFGTHPGLITLQIPESEWLRTDRDYLSLGVITLAENAVLVRVDSATSDDFLEMELIKGRLFVRYNFGTKDYPIGELDHKVNDGHYHVVQFSRQGANATLQVDGFPKVFKYPKGKQARYFDDQATVSIGGRGTGSAWLISGLNYNDYKILDMAAAGDASITIEGDVQQVAYPERAILSSMPPMLTDPDWTVTPTTGPICNTPYVTVDKPSTGTPTPTKKPMLISPTGDPADKGSDPPTTEAPTLLPTFLEHPLSAFIVKNQDVNLYCKALPVMQMFFKCNGEWLAAERHHHHETYDEFGIDHMMYISITISREEVEEYFGDFWCQCVAWADGGSMDRSDRAYIKQAYIRKSFDREPLGARVLKDNSIHLLCRPPRGEPEPDVYWEKDGVRVDTEDDHYLQTHEGSLIISTARMSDTGNYTCIAENIASKRKSETASVTVYDAANNSEDKTSLDLSGTVEADEIFASNGHPVVLPCNETIPSNDPSLPFVPYLLEWVRTDLSFFVLRSYGPFPPYINDCYGPSPPYINDQYSGRVSIVDSLALKIDDVRIEDDGWYKCQIINLNDLYNGIPPDDNVTSSHLVVMENDDPYFVETGLSTTIRVQEGEDAVLECEVAQLGQEFVVWMKSSDKPLGNGACLISVNSKLWLTDNRVRLEGDLFNATFNLHIDDVKKEDEGNYLCQIGTEPILSRNVSLFVND